MYVESRPLVLTKVELGRKQEYNRPILVKGGPLFMPKLVGDVEMVSLRIRLPKSARDEIMGYALASGMYDAHFYQAAIITGARILSQVFHNSLSLHSPLYNDADSAEAAAEEMTLRAKAERLRRSQARGRRRTRVDDYQEGLLTGGRIPPPLVALDSPVYNEDEKER